MIRLTPKQGVAVAEIVRDLTEAGHTVEIGTYKGSRTVTVLGGKKFFEVGGKGKVTEVA